LATKHINPDESRLGSSAASYDQEEKMPAYEYKTFDLPAPPFGVHAAMDKVLNSAAAEGWELVTVAVLFPHSVRVQTTAFMRRPLDH
jgi:hypothetical protein